MSFAPKKRETNEQKKTDADVGKHQFKKNVCKAMFKFATFQNNIKVLIAYFPKSVLVGGAQSIIFL